MVEAAKIVAAEWVAVAYFYLGGDPFTRAAFQGDNDMAKALLWENDGNLRNLGACALCGKAGHYHYGVVFQNFATDEVMVTGHQCADNLAMVFDRTIRRGLVAQAAGERKRAQAKEAGLAAIAEADEDVVAAFECEDDFVQDVKATVLETGTLTERQARAVVQAAERANTPDAPKVDAPEGRQTIVGTIVSAKWKESGYGHQAKGLVVVQTDDGAEWRAWGTLPKAFVDTLDGGFDLSPLEGRAVQFDATLKPSRDDASFAFWSRPTKASMV